MTNALQKYGEQEQAFKSLAATFVSAVLPAMAAAHPSADFNWRGNTQAFAQEYAQAVVGTGCTGKHIRDAVELMRKRSAYERQPPNPTQFKIMCLQAKGLPTLDQCLVEMDQQRQRNYGKDKQWSCAFVYWLNAAISPSRKQLPHEKWLKTAERYYTDLADQYARNELADIPLLVEHQQEPAYKRYLTEGGAA